MRRWLPSALIGGILVLLVLGWISLAPRAVGGDTVYVTTTGTSMEPGISDGDLILLRQPRNYEIGDVVAYETSDSFVLHRIVGVEGERYIVQGDNNSSPDAFRPRSSDIRGRLWLAFSPPWQASGDDAMVYFLASIALVVTALIIYFSRRLIDTGEIPKWSTGIRSGISERSGDVHVFMLGPAGQVIVATVAAIGLGALTLAVIGFSRPLETTAVETDSYEHVGAFAYSAPTTSAVYGDGVVQTGDPLYRDIVEMVTLEFDYTLISDLPIDATGTYRVDIVVGDGNGWNATLPLVDSRQLSNPRFTTTAVLDLMDIDVLIAAFEEQTGGILPSESANYEMSIVPVVEVNGEVGNQPIRGSFAPRYKFRVDDRMIALQDSQEAPESSVGAAIEIRQSGAVVSEQVIENRVALLPGDLDVATVRQIAIVGLALAVLLGLVALLMTRSAMQAQEPAQIHARHGSRIIYLRATNVKMAGRLVEVANFGTLVKVSNERRLPILHLQRNAKHFYLVHTAELTYGYQVISDRQSPPPERSIDSDTKEKLP